MHPPQRPGMMVNVMPLALKLTNREVADFISAPLRILIVVVIALTLRSLAGRSVSRIVQSATHGRIGRGVAALGDRTPATIDTSPEAVDRRRQRAATIGALLRSMVNVAILVLAGVTILGLIGVDLRPILASAGIVGVALGFGAQSVVKDVLSGLFMILEDTYAVGDVIDVGPATGTVEAMGLRSTRVRDVHGTVWHIRNGEIARVGNYSEAWQRALLDICVPADTELVRAERILDEAGGHYWTEQQTTGLVLERPSVWGVHEVRTEGIVLRLAVVRRAGQDGVDRLLRAQVFEAFLVEGVAVTVTASDLAPVPPPRSTD